jgi:hypothetical protein
MRKLLLAAVIVCVGTLGARAQDCEESAPIKFSGKSSQATAKFKYSGGLCLWKVKHNGTSNFQVHLLDTKGREIDTCINEIGRYDGTQVIPIKKAGEYMLNVTADGAWSITIEEPKPTATQSKPYSIKGKGRAVSEFINLDDGAALFKVMHQGEGTFRVKLFDAKGRLIQHIAAVIGPFEGSKIFTIEDKGTYILNISGDGDWKVSIE